MEESSFAFTHLRPNRFMQIFSTGPLLAGLRAARRIAVPAGEARISFVDARDVAAVAARTFLEGGHEKRAYDLTGPRALSILSAGLGPERANRLDPVLPPGPGGTSTRPGPSSCSMEASSRAPTRPRIELRRPCACRLPFPSVVPFRQPLPFAAGLVRLHPRLRRSRDSSHQPG